MKEEAIIKDSPILIAGSGKLASSVTVCLLLSGHSVTLYTSQKGEVTKRIATHIEDVKNNGHVIAISSKLKIIESLKNRIDARLVILITEENEKEKKDFIRKIERISSPDTIIATNTESISLKTLQEGSQNPQRIFGLNWTEPAHTTLFLELITNDTVCRKYIDSLYELAKNHWGKDPYIIRGNYGIRFKMLSALAREAFYLVENGYASVKDIDRACRNDAGFYLPFAGSFRYMDLMGTYIYGIVMKDLNPDLARSKDVPGFFKQIIENGGKGMENGRGFYQYDKEDKEQWDIIFRKFSYEIKKLMDKYPFNNA